MNDNQYIAHSGVVCHSGVKGMKWGKHLKAAKEEYEKAQHHANVLRDTANKAGKEAAAAVRERDYFAKWVGSDSSNNYNYTGTEQLTAKDAKDREMDARRMQGTANRYNEARAQAYSAQQKADKAKQAYENAKPINQIKNAVGKGYRVVKTKAGQVFGKPKITTKITNNGPVPHAGPLSYSETKKGIFGIPVTTKYTDRGVAKSSRRKR